MVLMRRHASPFAEQAFTIVTDDGPASTKRKGTRDSLFLSATIRVADHDQPITVRVRNLSDGGMMIDGHAQFVPGRRVTAELRGVSPVEGEVAWTEAGRAGVAFTAPIDSAAVRFRPSAMEPLLKLEATATRRPGVRSRP
jgi:hypothetical protein